MNRRLPFSQRIGAKPLRETLQRQGMDDELRNSLWNLFNMYYWREDTSDNDNKRWTLAGSIWLDYLKEPYDEVRGRLYFVHKRLREYFFKCTWHEVYSFIEFVSEHYSYEKVNKEFRKACNEFLEREMSAYRFVGETISEITSDNEIKEIEEAFNSPDPVQIHIVTALKHMSDNKNPDYRNSIKESISAVESICKLIAKNDRATLNDALNTIEKAGKIELHSALKAGFNSIYGYTSNASGIRHALLEKPKVDFDDAKFMLVACSAFINYLKMRAVKAGVAIT